VEVRARIRQGFQMDGLPEWARVAAAFRLSDGRITFGRMLT